MTSERTNEQIYQTYERNRYRRAHYIYITDGFILLYIDATSYQGDENTMTTGNNKLLRFNKRSFASVNIY